MAALPPASAALVDDAARFRAFNRLYTRFIGTLREGLLDTEYSLAEARVIYELATREAPTASEIAEALGLDAGYLSRLLAKLERGGLLKRTASTRDSRSADLTLTATGMAAFQKLNTRSDNQAREILEGLPPAGRAQLIHAMGAIETVLTPAVPKSPVYVLRPPRAGDMGWVVCREAVGYAEEYGFDATFEALAARIVADFVNSFDPRRERCWIAEVNGESAGHVFLVQHPDRADTAKLRLLFVEPGARGMGLGHALVAECIRFARGAGYKGIELWTQSILAGARRIYEKAGFHLVGEEPHHSFGQDLVAQSWELELD
jgi:DNA-binding MarR family transcriptional regulator/GNAT superfamily N-acetyltransferase